MQGMTPSAWRLWQYPLRPVRGGSWGPSQLLKPFTCTQNAVPKLFHVSPNYRFQEDKRTTALAILNNVKQLRHSPTPALALGTSGLIPFVAAPVYMVTTGLFDPSLAQAQLFYGASILSFIGGVRWGLTLPESSSQPPDWHNLGYSVTPSLIAWLGLLAPQPVGFLTVIGGLGLAGYMDLAMWGYPNWFKGMRFCLTFIAVLSLWTTLMFSLILKDKDVKKDSMETETERKE